MRCAKCGAKLKEGCLYCSVCGHEAQMVNGYSVLEEDYLKALLAEESGRDSASEKTKAQKAAKKAEEQKRKKKLTTWIILGCTTVSVVVLVLLSAMYIQYKNDNSYDYQIEMAEKELVDRNYERALSYYKNALTLAPNNIKARLAMADIYMKQGEEDAALVLYMEILTLDSKNRQAYQGLIKIYEADGEYEKIKELAQNVKDADILKLFSDYLVEEPVFYPDEGTYEIHTKVTILSIEECPIYYTMDGTDPREDGMLYPEDGIFLDEVGKYSLKAACKNEKGIYSDVLTMEYKVVATAPSYPKVTPDGGTISTLSSVTITAQEGCSIYYTWDGTDPTRQSSLYRSPIEIPEGNNILSVLVINNKTGLSSKVYRANFIYIPKTEEEQVVDEIQE